MSPTGGMPTRLLCAGLTVVLLASCSTLRTPMKADTVDVGRIARDVREGDQVQIARKDGSLATHTVVAVTDDALHVSDGAIVPLGDIQAIVVIRPGDILDDVGTGLRALLVLPLVLAVVVGLALVYDLAQKETQIGVR